MRRDAHAERQKTDAPLIGTADELIAAFPGDEVEGMSSLGRKHRVAIQDPRWSSVTLRYRSRLHHIGIGRTHAGTCVILLVQDLQIRIVDAATRELLRDLTLDPSRDYQPTRAPKGPARRPQNEQQPNLRSQVQLSPMS